MTVDETEFLILECRIKIRLNCILWLGFIQVSICFFQHSKPIPHISFY